MSLGMQAVFVICGAPQLLEERFPQCFIHVHRLRNVREARDGRHCEEGYGKQSLENVGPAEGGHVGGVNVGYHGGMAT